MINGEAEISVAEEMPKEGIGFLLGKEDLERLFKLRLVVARVGEMDNARWWNTQGMLGKYGRIALSRGFPKTHHFAQARVVFAVARSRCEELFNPPNSMTLWTLPAEVEDQFETRWQDWLDQADDWALFFKELEGLQTDDLLGAMQELKLLDTDQVETVKNLRRSAEGRAVLISGVHRPSGELLMMLAAGFSRGEAGQPAIPFAKLEG